MGGGGGGGMGTLEALLTELSGLKKPRGFINRHVRRLLGMRPKPPPKYRILVMMATNLPEALDEALLRPGRIDRIYKVGYPSKAGRVRTYAGYFAKVRHELTAEEMDKLATITPYATGATIKDLVNEALITAIRDGRDVITWGDVIKAKQLKELGPPEDVEYIERERHAVAVHEACHALVAYRTRQHMEIDIATIEKGSDYLGMVASIPPEDQFTRWRSEYQTDILVSLASLAGERMFFDNDSSSGVSGDLESATTVASFMEGFWGMGSTVSSYSTAKRLEVGSPGGGQGGRNKKGQDPEAEMRRALADRIEDNLNGLLSRVEEIIRTDRDQVLSLAHALETHKTLSGDDVVAVIERRPGPFVDGRPYADPGLIQQLEEYHAGAAVAHRDHSQEPLGLPEVRKPPVLTGRPVGRGAQPRSAERVRQLTGRPGWPGMRAAYRVRLAANLVNGSTLAGVLVAAAGRARLGWADDGLLVGTGYRLPVPVAPAFTVGNVILARSDRATLAAMRPLLAHEARHATQYACCLGLPMLPLYFLAAGVSWGLTGDFGSRNIFERRAGLADGGYTDRPLRPAAARLGARLARIGRQAAAAAQRPAMRRPGETAPRRAPRRNLAAAGITTGGVPPCPGFTASRCCAACRIRTGPLPRAWSPTAAPSGRAPGCTASPSCAATSSARTRRRTVRCCRPNCSPRASAGSASTSGSSPGGSGSRCAGTRAA